MRITRITLVLFVVSALLSRAQVTSQTSRGGRITGIVTSEDESPIQQAKVWAHVANRPTISNVDVYLRRRLESLHICDTRP